MKLFFPEPGEFANLPMAIPFDKNNFRMLRPRQCRIAFVDGGNAEVVSGSNFSAQLVRTYGCIWGVKREHAVRSEKPVVVHTLNKENKIIFSSSDGEEFLYDEPGLMTGYHAPSPGIIVEHIRRLEELKTAIGLVDFNPDIIVLDGSLETSTNAENALLSQLLRLASEKGIIVVGFSKTTSIITNTGASLVDSLLGMAEMKEWVYSPLAAESSICIAKLHSLGKAYRMDGSPEAAHCLAYFSNDAVFPGYPYPLIEADVLARITNNEALRYKLLLEKLPQLNDAHDILNMITNR